MSGIQYYLYPPKKGEEIREKLKFPFYFEKIGKNKIKKIILFSDPRNLKSTGSDQDIVFTIGINDVEDFKSFYDHPQLYSLDKDDKKNYIGNWVYIFQMDKMVNIPLVLIDYKILEKDKEVILIFNTVFETFLKLQKVSSNFVSEINNEFSPIKIYEKIWEKISGEYLKLLSDFKHKYYNKSNNIIYNVSFNVKPDPLKTSIINELLHYEPFMIGATYKETLYLLLKRGIFDNITYLSIDSFSQFPFIKTSSELLNFSLLFETEKKIELPNTNYEITERKSFFDKEELKIITSKNREYTEGGYVVCVREDPNAKTYPRVTVPLICGSEEITDAILNNLKKLSELNKDGELQLVTLKDTNGKRLDYNRLYYKINKETKRFQYYFIVKSYYEIVPDSLWTATYLAVSYIEKDIQP